MKTILYFVGICTFLCTSQFATAQWYVADSPFSRPVKAYEGQFIKDGDGVVHAHIEYGAPYVAFQTGDTVQVTGRCIGESSVGSQGMVKAIISHNGRALIADAFLLKYIEGQRAEDIFAKEDFSPNAIVVGGKKDAWQQRFNTMDVHSENGKFWYGSTIPIAIVILIISAFFLVIWVSPTRPFASMTVLCIAPLLMLASLCLEGLYIIRMGGQSVWWCNRDLVGLGGAILRSIPFVIAITMQIGFIGFYLKLFRHRTSCEVPVKWPIWSLFIMLVPGFFIAAYAACGITGISPSADFVNDLTPAQWTDFISKFLILFLCLECVIPILCGCVRLHSSLGVLYGIFITAYAFSTIAACTLLVFALAELLWAVLIEIFGGLIVLLVILVGGKTGGNRSNAGGKNPDGSPYPLGADLRHYDVTGRKIS